MRASLTLGLVALAPLTPLLFQFGDSFTRAVVPMLSPFGGAAFRLAPLGLASIWLLEIHFQTRSKTSAAVLVRLAGCCCSHPPGTASWNGFLRQSVCSVGVYGCGADHTVV